MATPKELLLETLEDLGAEDFKKFKWYLQEKILEGFRTIRRCRLENADRMETVDQMVQNYCIYTIKVARMVLEKIEQNELVKNLSSSAFEPTGTSLKKEYSYITKYF